ncbi:unnamed protein product [Caretta caretta]
MAAASASETLELNGQTGGGGGGGGERAPPDRPRPQRWLQGNGPINMNHYANKKSAAESMLDIALLMANASQLKAVMEQGPSFSFYIPLIVLISISLILQIGVGVLLIFLVKYDLNNPAKHAKLDVLNNLATGLTVSDKKRSEPLIPPLSTSAREPVKLGHRKEKLKFFKPAFFCFLQMTCFLCLGFSSY